MRNINKIPVFLTILFAMVLFVSCDDTSKKSTWVNLYGIDGWMFSAAGESIMKSLKDGGSLFLMNGSANDSSGDACLLVKLDESGAIVWQKKVSANFESTSFQVSESGAIYIAGRYARYDNTTSTLVDGGYSLTKISPDGAIIWKKLYNINLNPVRASIGIDDARGMIFVCAHVESSEYAYTYNALIAGISTDGTPQWEKILYTNSLTAGNISEMAVSPDGGCLIANQNELFKFTMSGQLAWAKSYTMPTGALSEQDADNQLSITAVGSAVDGSFIAAASRIYLRNNTAVEVMRTDSNGAVTWSAEITGLVEALPSSQYLDPERSGCTAYPSSICQTADGGFALLGNNERYVYYRYPSYDNLLEKASGWLVKFDNKWNITWQKDYNEKAGSFVRASDPPDRLIREQGQWLCFSSFSEIVDGGYAISGEISVNAYITTKVSGNDDPALILQTGETGAISNTQIIIKKMSAKVGALSISAGAASCQMGNASSSVSDVTAASTEVVLYSVKL